MKQMSCKAMKSLAVLAAILLLMGCPEDEADDDISISEITIYNIPAKILIDGKPENSSNPDDYNDTFKVYLNASDYQDDDKPPAAQGFVKINEAGEKQADGTYTVIIPLKKPIINLKDGPDGSPSPHNLKGPDGNLLKYIEDADPNDDLGPWKGMAKNFSVMLSPGPEAVAAHGVDAIWVKGNMTLNKSKARINFGKNGSLLDFRNPQLAGEPLFLADKARSLYNDLVCRDPDIKNQ